MIGAIAVAALLSVPVGLLSGRAADALPPLGAAVALPTASAALSAATESLTAAWGFSPTQHPSNCLANAARCGSGPTGPAGAGQNGGSPAPMAPVAFTPPPLTGSSIAYDAAGNDQYVVLFGGLLSSGHASNQTWSFVQGRWTNLTPLIKGFPPAPRWDAVMTWDARDGYIMLFGGCIAPPLYSLCTSVLNDTWSWSAGRWNELTSGIPTPPVKPPIGPPVAPPAAPAACWDAALTYDPNVNNQLGGVVLFGGAGALQLGLPGNVVPQLPVYYQTWMYAGGTWTNETSRSSSHPNAAYGARIANDPVSQTTLLFGGSNYSRVDTLVSSPPFEAGGIASGMAFNYTWQLSATFGWTNLSQGVSVGGPAPPPPIPWLSSNIPPARWDASMAVAGGPFQSQGDAIVLVGGTNATGAVLDDIWVFENPQIGWGLLAGPSSLPGNPGPAFGASPSPRWDAAFTYDPVDSFFLSVGGTNAAGTPMSDEWTLVLPSSWSSVSPYIPVNGATPGSLWESSAVFDDSARAAILFGGESCGSTACQFLSTTMSYRDGVWTTVTSAQSPTPRFGAAMSYYPLANEVVMFGGCGVICPLGDTWVFTPYSATTGSWTELFSAISPPARYFATLTFNPATSNLILFGGCEGSIGPCPAGDTWTYGTAGWSHAITPIGTSAPAPRFGASAAYSTPIGPGSGYYLLYGGEGQNGPLSDSWSYGPYSPAALPKGAAPVVIGWHAISTPTTPPARAFATLEYDRTDDGFLLFGGCGTAGCPSVSAWEFSLNPGQPGPPGPNIQILPANPWSAAPTSSSAQLDQVPVGLYGAAGAWDPIDGSAGYDLLIGGRMTNGETDNLLDAFAGLSFSDLHPYV